MKPKLQQHIGKRIRDIRKKQHLTQEQLAAWLHRLHQPITRNVIANWETGRGEVPGYCIQLIAFSLGVKVSDILPELTFKELIVHRLMPEKIASTK